MNRTRSFALFACVLVLTTVGYSQASLPMAYAQAATSKFVNLPVLPACMTISVSEGDPAKGAVIVLVRFTAGCVVPWHWHTANERLLIVSGTGKGEMRGGDKPVSLAAGDYILLPAKGVHTFTAVTSVELFLLSDAAFDIHYVDPAGADIPPESAFKPATK